MADFSEGLSLNRLQELINEEKHKKPKQNQTVFHGEDVSKALCALYEHVGVLPSKGANPQWKRPLISDRLFQSPILPPGTTLVEYDSLPLHIRETIPRPSNTTVVEVPLRLLHPEERPMQGNLSNKLSEYTRGGTTRRSPFRPGGIDTPNTDEQDEESPFRTVDCRERSRRVLSQSSRESWIDGSLLTSPPGGLKGLTWSDVHGEELEQQKESDASATPATTSTFETMVQQPMSNFGQVSSSSKSVFNKAYFDDDSLFGTSSSSSSEEDGDSYISESSDNEPPVEATVPVVDKAGENEQNVPAEIGIDELLSEMTVTDLNLYKKTTANPLDLAERQQQQQSDDSRKSWATTKLLPIQDFQSSVPNPALAFPFTLDGFQQQAIARLERSESVFVAAHTSAGKTVVAEYAVALAKQRATRCIYTSPIKALSNQKFRDFGRKFGANHIGLVTGDLQVNVEEATCLIMTTEILRSMLYRGMWSLTKYITVNSSTLFQSGPDVCLLPSTVNDTERGVVWEEVIIMLPSNVNLIFLSATTPNSLAFSDWIGRTKRKPVYVVRTDYRPVPLSHFLWAGNKLHKVLQGNGSFIEKGYSDASNALIPASAKDPAKAKAQQRGRPATGSKHLAWQAQGSKQNWMSLVRYLDRELLTPAVIFSFSKKKCEEIARMLSALDLNTSKERSAVQGFVRQTVARLSENDAKLPQVLAITETIQRGIGIHHGGLLPILKEMVEILFSRNLIKVLLATETFAMGVNMPAKAVVFNSIRKHDGIQFRVLEPGEYTQMAGRAGRRSLDKVGTVILCCFGEVPPPQSILRQMLTGTSMRLNSQFRLTYNMILNLLKVEEMSVEAMIKRSFSEFATQRALTANKYPQLLARGEHTLQKMKEEFDLESESRFGAEDILEYYHTTQGLISMTKDVLAYVAQNDTRVFQDIILPGRIIFVTAGREHSVVRAPAVILRSTEVSISGDSGIGDGQKKQDMICAILLPKSFVRQETGPKAPPGSIGSVGSSNQRHYVIKTVNLDQVLFVAAKKVKIDPSLILKAENKGVLRLGGGNSNPFSGMKALGKKDSLDDATKSTRAVDQVVTTLVECEGAETVSGMPRVELQNVLKRGIDVGFFRGLCNEIDLQVSNVRSLSSHRHPNLEKHYIAVERQDTLQSRVDTLKHLLSNESLQLFPDFLQRKSVLQRLGYIDEGETVAIKGRVACEVNTCEELIATEMVFEGVFSDLTPEEIAALLSALVFQEKSKGDELDSELPERIANGCSQMKQIATNLGRLQKECGLDVDPIDYCEQSLKFGLVHVVYEWALGIPFKDVVALTDVQEGSIVRCITRLDELCREIRNCARVVGNPTLYRQLEAASAAIKRDIVFASSLYVS